MELKTLKDIENEVYRRLDTKRSFNTFQDIKREAIKWVVELKKVQRKGDTLFKEHGKLTDNFEVAIYDYEQDDVYPMIKWIKYFFNITEEEIGAFSEDSD